MVQLVHDKSKEYTHKLNWSLDLSATRIAVCRIWTFEFLAVSMDIFHQPASCLQLNCMDHQIYFHFIPQNYNLLLEYYSLSNLLLVEYHPIIPGLDSASENNKIYEFKMILLHTFFSLKTRDTSRESCRYILPLRGENLVWQTLTSMVSLEQQATGQQLW